MQRKGTEALPEVVKRKRLKRFLEVPVVERKATEAISRYWSNVKSMLQCQGEHWNDVKSDTVLGGVTVTDYAIQGDVKWSATWRRAWRTPAREYRVVKQCSQHLLKGY